MAKKVLIIDDSVEDINSILNTFAKSKINVLHSQDPFSTIGLIYKEAPDLVILDILMPELGGYELCRMIKSDENAKEIPVIIYSKLDKNIDKFWAYRSGAAAFVNKGEMSQELLNVCLDTMEKNPVTLETKGKLLNAKQGGHFEDEVKTLSKEDLIKDFNSIKEIDTDCDILAVKIFGTINRYFKYDCAMLCFADSDEKNIIYCDKGHYSLNDKVFEEIKEKTTVKNPEINVILQKEKKGDVSSIEDFCVKYEYEISVDSNTIGCLYLYAKENLNSAELKLVGTIKDLVEHIMRLRYFKIYNKDENSKSANPKKLYTQLDFDRILSYECGWHKRNNAPLSLAFIEIESLENIESKYGKYYGDLLLARVSNFLSGCLSDGDFIYRNEDNIFTILMTNSDKEIAQKKLEFLVSKIKDPKRAFIDEDEEILLKACALMLSEKYKNHYEYIDALYDVLDMVRHSKNDIIIK